MEAARFMEIFLYKLSELLLEGDRFKIADFGEFVISSQQKGATKSKAAGKIFLFTPQGESGSVTFGAPTSYSANVNPLDPLFTLGINRRFIPVRGEVFSSDGLPSGPDEMRKYLEQHAGLLLQEGTFVRSQTKGASEPQEDENLPSEAFLPFSTPKLNLTAERPAEPEETAWEFGNDWKKEYEEDLLLESGEESARASSKVSKTQKESELSGWDFGQEEEIKSKSKPEEEEDSSDEFDLSAFAPVRSMTREMEIDLSELDTDTESDEESEESFEINHYKDTEQEEDEYENDEEEDEDEDYEDDIIPEDFDSLFKKSLAENVMNAGPAKDENEDEGDFGIDSSGLELTEEDYDEDGTGLSRSAREAVDLRGQRLSRHISPEEEMEFSGIKGTVERAAPIKQKSYIGYYIIAFLLLSGVGFLVYSKLYGMPMWASDLINKKAPEIQLKASPTVVERDYAFPVSYPYDKIAAVMPPQTITEEKTAAKDSVKQEPAKQEPAKQEPSKPEPAKQTPVKQETAKPVKQEPPKKVVPPPVEDKGKKISSAEYKGAFIEPSQKGFEIQVMSLGPNDKASAEKAASRLRSLGLNSFVVEKEIPKRGVVNRVRVGPFSSRQDAEKALRKIKGE